MERGRGRGTGKKVRNEKRERLHEKHVSTVHSSSHVGLNWEFDGGETGAMVVVIRVVSGFMTVTSDFLKRRRCV